MLDFARRRLDRQHDHCDRAPRPSKTNSSLTILKRDLTWNQSTTQGFSCVNHRVWLPVQNDAAEEKRKEVRVRTCVLELTDRPVSIL